MSNLHPVFEQALRPFAPRFEHTSCSQCGHDTGPGDAGHSSCATHALDHINALASVNCIDDISRREKLASIRMLASEAIEHGTTQSASPAAPNLSGMYPYEFETSLGLCLRCYLDYEPAEPQTHLEPGCSERIELVYAFAGLIDISEVLHGDVKALIEEDALADRRKQLAAEIADFNYDRAEEIVRGRMECAA